MNKRLDDAISRVKALPDDRQSEIADVLIHILDHEAHDIILTPEQIAEIEQALSDDEPFASEAEVREVFDRLTK